MNADPNMGEQAANNSAVVIELALVAALIGIVILSIVSAFGLSVSTEFAPLTI